MQFLYTFNYDYHHFDLCELECRQLFGVDLKDKIVFSSKNIDLDVSPFIKSRVEIITSAESFSVLKMNIKDKNIRKNDFKVEYLPLDGDLTEHDKKHKKVVAIGYCIEAEPNFKNPKFTYCICYYKGVWYFGLALKQQRAWRNHKVKPYSFSNSIGMTVAKTLVSTASQGDKSRKLLDACCGVGTIMLEACFANIAIEGCDLNPNSCNLTTKTSALFG